MRFLADACALIVFHGYGGQAMTEAGKEAMSTGDVFVSAITVWEITRRIALGKLARPAPPGFNGTMSAWLHHAGYRMLPLTWEVSERANAMPMHHQDPMDRMLIAAAFDAGLVIVTEDQISLVMGSRPSGSAPTPALSSYIRDRAWLDSRPPVSICKQPEPPFPREFNSGRLVSGLTRPASQLSRRKK